VLIVVVHYRDEITVYKALVVKYFRIASISEGLSYLAVLSITFGVVSREYVFPLGMAHGVLFIIYLILSLQVSHKRAWSLVVWLLIFFASLVPFAFIAVELFLRKEMSKDKVATNV